MVEYINADESLEMQKVNRSQNFICTLQSAFCVRQSSQSAKSFILRTRVRISAELTGAPRSSDFILTSWLSEEDLSGVGSLRIDRSDKTDAARDTVLERDSV